MIDQSILQQHVKAVTDVVRFLDSSHLSPELTTIPLLFEKLAADLLTLVPSSAFLIVASRALVTAKNEAVIAHIYARENNLTHWQPLNTIKTSTKEDL